MFIALALFVCCIKVPAANQMWNDMDFVRSQPIRLLFCFFERDQWRATSVAGRKLLTGLLCVLPDNKIVEDIHGYIRKEAKSHPNAKLTTSHLQEIIVRSKVFESRGIRHAAALSRDVFATTYRRFKRAALSRHHFCQKHKMQPRWIKLVGRRTWKPLTEEGCHLSQAAFRWLLNRQQGEKLENGLFSKLVFPFVVICSAGLAYASLGNAAWAVLAWPLIPVAGGYVFQPAAGVRWLHVTDPSQWEVIEVEGAFRPSMGIVLNQVGEPLPLIRYFVLRHPHSNKIVFQDVCRIAVHLGCFDAQAVVAQSRDQLMTKICEHFGDVYEPKKPEVDVADVSVLEEAVFEDMDKTEQLEFPEIDKKLKQQKARRAAASFKFEKAKAKAKAKPRKRKAQPANARAKRRRTAEEPAAEVAPHDDDDEAAGGDEAGIDAAMELAPPAAPVPPPVPAAVAEVEVLPPAAAAAAAGAHARGGIVRHHEGYISWQDSLCEICNQVAGQFKLEEMPGGRDQPTWHMRVRDPETMEWAGRAPRLSSRRTSVVGESTEFALQWIRENRHCHFIPKKKK